MSVTSPQAARSTRRAFLRRLTGSVVVAAAGVSVAGCAAGERGDALTFWDNLLGGELDVPRDQWFITEAVARFRKAHPNINFRRSQQTPNMETFRAASIAENGPDLISFFAGADTNGYAQFLQPLDELLDPAVRRPVSGWETVRKDYADSGAVLAIPFGAGSYFEVLYNKELFAKAGLARFTPPASWEEFLALGKRLQDAGVVPLMMGEQQGYTGAWVLSVLAGGHVGKQGLFDLRIGRIPFDHVSIVRAYDGYQQLHRRGLTNPGAASTTSEEAGDRFVRGDGAMYIQGGWFNQIAYDGMGDKVGTFPIPTFRDARHPGVIAGGPTNAIAVTRYSRRKQEAVAFLEFMLGRDILDLYVRKSGVEGSNHEDARPGQVANPLLREQLAWLDTRGTVFPIDSIMSTPFNEQFYRVNPAVLAGRTSPRDGARLLRDIFERLD